MALGATFHSANRKKIQESLSSGEILVVTAHARLQKSADLTFFSQDRDFLYLVGIDEPDWLLVVTQSEEFLISPKLAKIERIFDGGLTAETATQVSGVAVVYEDKVGWKKLDGLLKKAKEVQIVLHEDKLWFRTHPNPAHRRLARRIRARTKADIVSIHPQIHALRAIKQSKEIAAIQKAIDITGETLADIKNKIKTYKQEYEISADLSAGFMKRGSKGHGFEPIVAGGINACTVHYIANDKPLNANETVLLDVGAEFSHYSADISRVYSLSKPTTLQSDVMAAVNEVVDSTIAMIKPGLLFSEYAKKVDSMMGQKLLDLGLIQKPSYEAIRQYFPYGVSHMLGLDIHDVSSASDSFLDGMVLTVEPGIHIADEKIGVRIEENILVTKSGAKNLSAHIPRDL